MKSIESILAGLIPRCLQRFRLQNLVLIPLSLLRGSSLKGLTWCIWPSLEDSGAARKAALQGLWAAGWCALLAVVSAVFGVLDVQVFDFRFSPSALADAAFFVIIAIGIYKMSRTAAVAGAAFFLLDQVETWIDYGPRNIIMALVIMTMFINSIRGTLAHHKSANCRTQHPVAGLAVKGAVVVLFLLLMGAGFLRPRIHSDSRSPVLNANLTMQQAWDFWMNNRGQASGESRQIASLVRNKLSRDQIALIREELLDTEVLSKTAANPLIPLREAIMNAVNRSVFTAAVMELDGAQRERVERRLSCTEDALAAEHLSNRLMLNILRFYSVTKYDDGAEKDWFTFYLDAACANVGNVMTMLGGGVVKAKATVRLLGPHHLVAEGLRQQLLYSPPRTPFMDRKAS